MSNPNHKRSAPIAAIIIQYGDYTALTRCLESLSRGGGSTVDVWVVDNNPPVLRDTALYEDRFPAVRCILPATNEGYSGGANVGLNACHARPYDHFCILNNDVQVTPDDLTALQATFASDERIGIAGPAIRDLVTGALYAGMQIDWQRGKTRHTVLEGPPGHDAIRDVDLVEGCVLMLSRKAVEHLHGFDDQFFLYWEDTDLCVRAQQQRLRCVVNTAIIVGHEPSSTTEEGSPMREYYLTRNRLVFFATHTPGFLSKRRLVLRMSVSKVIIGLRLWCYRRGRLGKAYCAGVCDFYTGSRGKTNRYLHSQEPIE